MPVLQDFLISYAHLQLRIKVAKSFFDKISKFITNLKLLHKEHILKVLSSKSP